MAELNVTAGEWALELTDDHSFIVCGEEIIARIDTWMDEEKEANGNLLAAAKLMYAALEPIAAFDSAFTNRLAGKQDDYPLFGLNGVTLTVGDIRRASQALAAARGEKESA